MTQSFGRDFFHSIAGDLWSSFQWVRDLEEPSSEVDLVARLEDEAELRELVARYAFSHDSKNEAWTTSLFMPDGIMGHRDGAGRQSEGRAAITERFKGFNTFPRLLAASTRQHRRARRARGCRGLDDGLLPRG